MTMANTRNYTDAALEIFVKDLEKGEQTMLRVGGALPATFRDLDPKLGSKDVVRMIELVERSE
jgi:hypothetical protein